MKSLIFLFMSVFLFAHSQTKPPSDSAKIKMQILSEQTNDNLKLATENKQLLSKLFQKRAKRHTAETRIAIQKPEELKAIKPENDLIPHYDGDYEFEYVRGSWIYRILHKNDYKIKIFKWVGDEKVYLN